MANRKNVLVASPTANRSKGIMPLRIDAESVPICSYYAITGPSYQDLLDPRIMCHDDQGKASEHLLDIELWGYDPTHLSELPPASANIPLSPITKHHLACRCVSLYIPGGPIVRLRLEIIKVLLTEERHLLRLPSPTTDLSERRPFSAFVVGSILTTLYCHEFRLGRLTTCYDPARKTYQRFDYVPGCLMGDNGLLPLDYWPHWPKP